MLSLIRKGAVIDGSVMVKGRNPISMISQTITGSSGGPVEVAILACSH
jgi:hypothetical protein